MFKLESPEELEIRNSVSSLMQKEISKYQSSQHYGKVPRTLFNLFAGLGLTGLAIEEKFGGAASSTNTGAVVYEEIAKFDLGPAIFLSVHSLASRLVQKFGSDEQRSRFLPTMAKGGALGAFALTEPGAGSDAASLRTTATSTSDGYILNGSKTYITSAGFADIYIVFAKTTGQKISAFIVESNTKGLSAGPPENKMGCELSPIAPLTFDNALIPKQNLLGEEGKGLNVALGGLSIGRVNIAACAIGLASEAITIALRHTKEREQFGQRLFDFQGLQFMLADMHMKLQAAKLLTWYAAKTIDEGNSISQHNIASSTAKCFASDAAMSITTDAVQLLGGAGYIKDYKVERYMRDAKMLQIVEGTNQIQRVIIAREMGKEGYVV